MGQYTRGVGQSHRRESIGQQDRYLLVCVMKKGGETLERHKMTFSRQFTYMFQTILSETDSMTVPRGLNVRYSGTHDHSPAPCSFTGFHQRTPELSVQPRNAVLFTDESKFTINNTAEHSLKHHLARPVWQWVTDCLERYAHWHCSSCKNRYCCSCC